MVIKGQSYKGILGTHLVGQQARSSHLGYDCYLTGSAHAGDLGAGGTGAPGKVRMVLRPNRLSPRITEATRTILPQEMWWPQRNHSGAHGCIDAVLTQDHRSMQMWKQTWPNHEFGFEDFLVWCQRATANGIPAPRAGTLDHIATHTSSNVPRSTRPGGANSAPLFPIGQELADQRVLIKKLDQDGYQVRIYVAKFRDRSQALRVDVLGQLAGDGDEPGLLGGGAGGHARRGSGTGAGGRVLLGRAYVDLADDRIWQVIENHPGTCKALDLPTGLIYHVIGVTAPDTLRTMRLEQPPSVQRVLTPRQKAVEVGMAAAQLNGLAEATVGDLGPVQAGPARMAHLRNTNRRDRGGRMDPPVRGNDPIEEVLVPGSAIRVTRAPPADPGGGMYGAGMPFDDSVFPGAAPR
jgi:hypothetical protein